MKAVVVLCVLALAACALAGCSTVQQNCLTAYENCTGTGTPNAVATCECSIAYKTCLDASSCCVDGGNNLCSTRCASNCGNNDCTWPPILLDNCDQRSICHQLNNCGSDDCVCQMKLRQCLLSQGCSYDSSLADSCTSQCASRNPIPECSAQAQTDLPSPSAPSGCTAIPPYIQTGDCTCRDDIRAVAPNANCSSSTWEVTGPFTLSTTITLQYDTLKINGDFTVSPSGNLAFVFATNTDSGNVVVDGTAQIQGEVNIEITNPDPEQKNLTLLTADTVTVSSMAQSLKFPTLAPTLCLVNRQYFTPVTDITFSYKVSTNPQDCTATQTPTIAPSVTTGVAPRPSPIAYTPPSGNSSTLGVFASVALLIAAFVAKFL